MLVAVFSLCIYCTSNLSDCFLHRFRLRVLRHFILLLVVGYGIFTRVLFQKGEFVLEYAGDLISWSEGEAKTDQTYLYYFEAGSRKYW